MVKIVVGEDCGNSPKKKFLRDLHIAFVRGETPFVVESLSDDITWTIVGQRQVRGKSEMTAELERIMSARADELVIHTIITHGKDAAVNGEITMEDGKTFRFCDVYKFKGAKGNTIQTITSYVIEG